MLQTMDSTCKCFAVILLNLILQNLQIQGAVMNNEVRLGDYILSSYNKQARPVLDPDQTLNTTFGIEIVQLIKVDDRNQMLTTKVMVRQSWRNMLISWNNSEWKGVADIQLEGNLLWYPDIVLYNNADTVFPGGTEKYRTKIVTTNTGLSYWFSPATFTSACSIDIKYFPFDQQKCFLKFGSWTFSIKGINLHLDNLPLVTGYYANSSEWDLVNAYKERNVVQYTCCPYPYVDLTFNMVLRRKPLYYVFNVILPCLVLVTTILFGFFLPPESGERISLTITILLAIAVFLQLISDALPRNSDSIPILAIFYMVIMAESAISLITTCVVLVIHYRNSDKGSPPMPEWVRKVFLVHCANILGVKGNINMINNKIEKEEDERKRKDNVVKKQVRFGSVREFSCDSIGNFHDLDDPMEGLRNEQDVQSAFDGTLDDILGEVKYITESMLNDNHEEKLQEEWRFLAKVLDRLFFWLFLLTVITSATCILVPVYFIHHDN